MRSRDDAVGRRPRSRSARAARAAARAGALGWLVIAASGCQPRIVVEAPQEPIVIHMNIKIEHDIRVRVDRELDELFASEKDLF